MSLLEKAQTDLAAAQAKLDEIARTIVPWKLDPARIPPSGSHEFVAVMHAEDSCFDVIEGILDGSAKEALQKDQAIEIKRLKLELQRERRRARSSDSRAGKLRNVLEKAGLLP